MDRWENQSGWSPGTIASEIAGLICAADLARKAGDDASAATYEATADQWQKSRELDGHHQRPVLRQALLPAPDQGRQPERRQHVLDRGQRAERGR
ncbi:MAG: glycoside hydrolase family 15 protein [Solirubrobacteraceae bacterium]